MDNLGSHDSEHVRGLIGATGALFLPPYSLDLNLIELMLANHKILLRKLAAHS